LFAQASYTDKAIFEDWLLVFASLLFTRRRAILWNTRIGLKPKKINTVHVSDVCKALWHLAVNGTVGAVYNLADKDNLDQKTLNVVLEKIFGIKTGHLGTIKSEAVKLMDTESLVGEINGEHAPIWAKMIGEAKITHSPLTPWLDNEALLNCNLCVDGTAIEKTGFTYDHPHVSEDLIRQQVAHAVENGWFPPNLA